MNSCDKVYRPNKQQEVMLLVGPVFAAAALQ